MPKHSLMIAALFLVAALPTASVAQNVRVWTSDPDRTVAVMRASDRPMLGITTATESQRADTLGLLIDDVRKDSPADKAGLKAGDRLQAISSVSLRADRGDAGQRDYNGVLTRRLQRAMGEVKDGETVTLRVLSEGRARDVRVAPARQSALYPATSGAFAYTMGDRDRATLGVMLGTSPSPRDTLGVFVQSVTSGGPAETAGLIEGDRIAAINGVSLRVAREDVDDPMIARAKASRLSAEVAKLSAGDVAEVTVVSAGRMRTVRVTTVKASELPRDAFTVFIDGVPFLDGMVERLRAMPAPPRPPAPPTPPAAPRRPLGLIRI